LCVGRVVSSVQIDSDDPAATDLLAAIVQVLAESGGWLHPQARLICRDGDLSLQCRADDGEPLVRVPHEAMVPVSRMLWTTSDDGLAFTDLPEGLAGPATEIAYLHVALLNQCRKLADLHRSHPLLAPLTPGVIEAVRAFRPSFRTRPIDPTSLLWSTRCFRLSTGSGAPEPVAIPVVDLLDHHGGGATGVGHGSAFTVPISRPLGDDTCLLDYGWQRDAIGMAVVYGFADVHAEIAHSAPLHLLAWPGSIEVRGVGRDAHGRLLPMRARIDGGHLDISHLSFGAARAPQVELMAATGLDRGRAQLVIEAVAEANLERVAALERTAIATQGPAATTLLRAAQRQAAVIRTFLERVRDPSLT